MRFTHQSPSAVSEASDCDASSGNLLRTLAVALKTTTLANRYESYLAPLLSRVRFARRLEKLVSGLGLETASNRGGANGVQQRR